MRGRARRMKLIDYRKAHNLTQAELGARAGTTRDAIAHYERCTADIPGTVLQRLGAVLHAPLEELLVTETPELFHKETA